MCDQTEYKDGDIVWVRFQNLWWPAEVVSEARCPDDLVGPGRRRPIVIVQFFNERTYECVYNLKDICRYNNSKKDAYLRKGYKLYLDGRDNMPIFLDDVRDAETKTNGDPNILEKPQYQPAPKPDYASIFGSKSQEKKIGSGRGRGRGRRKAETSTKPSCGAAFARASASRASLPGAGFSESFYRPSTSAMLQSPSSATINSTDYQCHLCPFRTHRLNIIILHNKTHSNEPKKDPRPTAKDNEPVASTSRATPKKPRAAQKVTKPAYVDTSEEDIIADIDSDDNLVSSSENNRKKVSPAKRGRKPSPKKRPPARKSAPDPIVSTKPTPPPSKPKTPRKTRKSTAKKVEDEPEPPAKIKEPERVLEPIEIKSTILADWSEDEEEEDQSKPSTSNIPIESVTEKSLDDSSSHSGDEKQKSSKTIRNIPKKDRRGIVLDEFYSNQVASSTDKVCEAIVEPEGIQSEVKATEILIDSDDELVKSSNSPKVAEEVEATEEKITEEQKITQEKIVRDEEITEETTEIIEEIVTEVEVLEQSEEITADVEKLVEPKEEKPVDDGSPITIETEVSNIYPEISVEEDENGKDKDKDKDNENEPENKDDLELLKQSDVLLEETSQLQKEIESVGIIGKKRRLQSKHKNDDDSDSAEKTKRQSVDIELSTSSSESKPHHEIDPSTESIIAVTQTEELKRSERRRSSARLQSPIPTELKTYRSTRRSTKSSQSGDEKLPENIPEQIPERTPTKKGKKKAEPIEETPSIIVQEVELMVDNVEISAIENIEVKDDQLETLENVSDIEPKSELETSPHKSDLDTNKTDVDCFDFREEDEEIPQSLNRRKRRFLPPGKVFELQSVDKLEEIRRKEEEKSKRLKFDKEDETKETDDSKFGEVEKDTTSGVKAESCDKNASPEKSPEKQQKDEEIKDKTLPPKERGKRIFKSRNRSRLSEGDSFSTDDKSRELNQSTESIGKQAVDSSIEASIRDDEVKINDESVTIIESTDPSIEPEQKEIDSSIESENDRIESEIANTLITMTATTVNPQNNSKKHRKSDATVVELEHSGADVEEEQSIKVTFTLEENVVEEAVNDADNEEEKVTPTKAEPTKDEELSKSSKPTSVKKRRSIVEDESDSSEKLEGPKVSPPKQVKTSVLVSTAASVAKSSKSPIQKTEPKEKPVVKPTSTSALTATPASTTIPAPTTSTTQTLTKVEVPKSSQIDPKPSTSGVNVPSSPSSSKKKSQRSSKKVPVTIGFDTQGNEIITWRYPSDKPVVHLPPHIQTPDMVQSAINPRMMHKKEPPMTQANTTTVQNVMGPIPSTSAMASRSGQKSHLSVRGQQQQQQQQQRSVVQQAENKQMHHFIIHEQPMQQQQQQQQHQLQQQQIRNILQMHQSQHVRTNIQVQQPQPQQQQQQQQPQPQPQPSTSSGIRAAPSAKMGRQTKRQTSSSSKKQETAPVALPSDILSQELLVNQPENQLLAIPANNFHGPSEAFFLCTAESGKIEPIDRVPLYLDKTTNQLIPAGVEVPAIQDVAGLQDVVSMPDVAPIQEEITEDESVVQEAIEYQEEQISQNIEDGTGVRYMLDLGNGQRILLDQNSYEQLTQGQMPTLVTPDGQQIMLQIQPHDLLAAVQSNQSEVSQIIIPEELIEEETHGQDILAAALAESEFQQDHYIGEVMQQIEGNSIEVEPLGFQHINQAPTSETNAILEQPPIMSTLEQPSKKDVSLATTTVDCSNLDASLAVIGVTAPSTNVPTSLELPITVTNPAIAPKTTNAMTTIYPSSVPTTLPIGSLTGEFMSPTLAIVGDTIEIEQPDEDMNIVHLDPNVIADYDASGCEIVPNTPESVKNHGFMSDNSNSSEIPIQSNLILRTTTTENDERVHEMGNGNRTSAQNNHEQSQQNNTNRNNNSNSNRNNNRNNNNNNERDVNSLILNENSFDQNDGALLLHVNNHSNYQRIGTQNHITSSATTNSHTNGNGNGNNSRNNRNGRQSNRSHLNRSNTHESNSFVMDEDIIAANEYDSNDIEMSDRYYEINRFEV